MARIPWVFTDPLDSSTYSWEINPNDGGSPAYQKTVAYTASAAPDGSVIMQEGRDAPQKLNFSGVVLTESQYEAMFTWFNKRHQILLTDDLGRTFNIYITNFEPRRVRSHQYPWRHTYSVEAVII